MSEYPVYTIGQAKPTSFVQGYDPNLNYHKGGTVPKYSSNEVHISTVANGYIMECNRGEGMRADCLVFMNQEDLGNHIRLYGLTIGKTESERIEGKGF